MSYQSRELSSAMKLNEDQQLFKSVQKSDDTVSCTHVVNNMSITVCTLRKMNVASWQAEVTQLSTDISTITQEVILQLLHIVQKLCNYLCTSNQDINHVT